jgi:hypothetical protein
MLRCSNVTDTENGEYFAFIQRKKMSNNTVDDGEIKKSTNIARQCTRLLINHSRLPDAPYFSLYTPFKSKSGGCTNHVQITAPRSHKSYCTLRLVSMSKQNIYWNIEITDGVSHTDKKMEEIFPKDRCKVKYEEGPPSM